MRKLFFLLPLIFLSCKESPKPNIQNFSKSPNWYENRDISKKSFEIVGYGFGNNEVEAKKNARKDIVEQISISVKSKTEKYEKRVGETYSDNFSTVSIQKANLTLTNLETIRISKNRKFIALKYSNLPFEKKFLKKLGKYSCGSKNSFLENTKLGKLAIQENSCLSEIAVFKNENSIFLNSGNISELLPNLSTLFFEKKDSQIFLDIPKSKKEREEFEIYFKTSKNGFVNILLITENGEVFEVLSNHFSESREKISVGQLLDKKFFGIVENGNNFEKSMFIGIFSEKSLETNFLQIRDESDKYQEIEFSKFLKLFENSKFLFSGKIITIFQNK